MATMSEGGVGSAAVIFLLQTVATRQLYQCSRNDQPGSVRAPGTIKAQYRAKGAGVHLADGNCEGSGGADERSEDRPQRARTPTSRGFTVKKGKKLAPDYLSQLL